jgi:pimeloyl-ACP methyl ester carboxylesterase
LKRVETGQVPELADAEGFGEFPCLPVGAADVADLSLLYQGVESATPPALLGSSWGAMLALAAAELPDEDERLKASAEAVTPLYAYDAPDQNK